MSTTDTGPQWERLARFVHLHRTRQGLTQREVTERGGPSDTLLGLIEAGDWRPGRGVGRTLEKLDRGMGWQPGSASRTLAGGDPAEEGSEFEAPTRRRRTLRDMSTEDLMELQADIQAEIQERYKSLRGTPERGRRRHDEPRGWRDQPGTAPL